VEEVETVEIKLRSLESNLLHLTCSGVVSQAHSGDKEDPLQVIGDWQGNVLLSLQQSEYIDSSGIAWLLYWHRHVAKAGGIFAICAVPPRVDQVLQLCQLHRVLSIWEDEAAARAALTTSTRQPPGNASIDPPQGNTANAH
jgi:anti-anti-sigma factor